MGNRYHPELPQTICWDCRNATGHCSWSRYKSFRPVEGWDVIPTKINDGTRNPQSSYIVLRCPLFDPDDKR